MKTSLLISKEQAAGQILTYQNCTVTSPICLVGFYLGAFVLELWVKENKLNWLPSFTTKWTWLREITKSKVVSTLLTQMSAFLSIQLLGTNKQPLLPPSTGRINSICCHTLAVPTSTRNNKCRNASFPSGQLHTDRRYPTKKVSQRKNFILLLKKPSIFKQKLKLCDWGMRLFSSWIR